MLQELAVVKGLLFTCIVINVLEILIASFYQFMKILW